MAKLPSTAIGQSDIRQYLENYSDFSFEIRVLKEFINLGLNCAHGGTYEDPVTKKNREFDIRALLENGRFRIHLSVECKNLRNNFPLIIHSMCRKPNESYTEFIQTYNQQLFSEKYGVASIDIPAFRKRSNCIRVEKYGLYQKDEFVGKSTDQISKNKYGEITSNDMNVFEKISQAINAAVDLISQAHFLDTSEIPFFISMICPVLVIPDGTLWEVRYSEEGDLIGEPESINHISYYIGKEWTVGGTIDSQDYTMSHLEIVTYSEINNFINTYLKKFLNQCIRAVNYGVELS